MVFQVERDCEPQMYVFVFQTWQYVLCDLNVLPYAKLKSRSLRYVGRLLGQLWNHDHGVWRRMSCTTSLIIVLIHNDGTSLRKSSTESMCIVTTGIAYVPFLEHSVRNIFFFSRFFAETEGFTLTGSCLVHSIFPKRMAF